MENLLAGNLCFEKMDMFSLTNFCLLVSDVYSFEEEEAVLDPHISEHLSHFGIDMLQMQKRVSYLCFAGESSCFQPFNTLP